MKKFKFLITIMLATFSFSSLAKDSKRLPASIGGDINNLGTNEVAFLVVDGKLQCVQRGEEDFIREGQRGVILTVEGSVKCQNFVKPFAQPDPPISAR